MKLSKFLLLMPVFLASCHFAEDVDKSDVIPLKIAGDWLFELTIDQESIPFNARFQKLEDGLSFEVINAEETLQTKDIVIKSDSIFIKMPYFNSHFIGKLNSDQSIVGNWFDPSRPDQYFIPFKAKRGSFNRFKLQKDAVAAQFDGKWKITFDPESENPCQGIGLFKQTGRHLKGTILSETGDYRFLEGVVDGDQVYLSCFDGAHAFLFKGTKLANGSIDGHFWSGKHWTEPWVGERDSLFALAHPDSLTFLTNQNRVDGLSFKDFNNNSVSLGSDQFKNKVLIVQIMGTWCPNCLDECKAFKELYDLYHSNGLEIVAIAYEKGKDLNAISKRVARFKHQIDLEYPILYGGGADKSLASSHFNMLNKIISFPTAIFVDKKGNIRRIHTGYYGPGTGAHHIKYKKQTQQLLDSLLNEPVISS